MAKTGRAVIAQGQDFEIREYPVLDPEPGKVLLRQELAGICGTDLHMWQNGFQGEVVLGHENVGVIEAIGAGGAKDYIGRPLEEGDRVIFSPAQAATAHTASTTPPTFAPHFYGGFADYIYLGFENTCMLKTRLLARSRRAHRALHHRRPRCHARQSAARRYRRRPGQRRHRPRYPPLRQTDGRRQHHRRRRPRQTPRTRKRFRRRRHHKHRRGDQR